MDNKFTQFKINEHSVRNFWKEALDDFLRCRNIQIIYDPTIKKEKGVKFPDFYILNNEKHLKIIVETKLGDKCYNDAIIDGYEKMLLTEADISLAVAFPENLKKIKDIKKVKDMLPAVKPYKAQARINGKKYNIPKFKRNLKSEANYSDLNDFFLEIIDLDLLSGKEKEESSLDSLIKILRDNVDSLFQHIQYTSEEDIKKILGGQTFFENILGFGNNEIQENKTNLTKVISFLLVLQLIFYFKIQKWFPSLEPINAFNIFALNDIKKRFKKVVNTKNWKPVFNYDILSNFIGLENESEILKDIRLILVDIEQIFIQNIKDEVLGIIFHQLIPIEIRKVVAAYYTTISSAQLLAHLSVKSHSCQVIDLACGSGNLLSAVYKEKRKLFEKNGNAFVMEDHKKFIENDIYGIDIMPFATLLTTINLSLQSPVSYTNKVNIGTEDATRLKPGDIIYPTFRTLKQYITKNKKISDFMGDNLKKTKKRKKIIPKGAISMDGKKPSPIHLLKYDLVIMNPPFTKNENLSKIKFTKMETTKRGEKEVELTYKDILKDRLKEYKGKIHGQMGLFAYFLLLADRFLKSDGRIACVLPASILRIKSCKKIRDFIAENYNINYIISRVDQLNFSENTGLREILFIIKKKNESNKKNQLPCCYIELDSLPNDEEKISEIAELILKMDTKNDKYDIIKIPQNKMVNTTINWFIPIATTNKKLKKIWQNLISNNKTINYLKIVKRENIIRGLDSSDKEEIKKYSIIDPLHFSGRHYWKFEKFENNEIHFFNKSEIDRYKIPSVCVKRGLRTTVNLKKLNIKNLNDYFIVEETNNIVEILSTYYNIPEEEVSYDEIKSWKKKVEDRSSKLFHIRRFDIAAPGTYHISYTSEFKRAPTGLTWVFRNIDNESSKLIALWNESSLHILQIILNRKETAGSYMAIDSYHFSSYFIIDINALSEEERKKGIKLYDRIKSIEFPSILEQLKTDFKIRIEIDSFFLNILYEGSEIQKISSELREQLKQEVLNLQFLRNS
ncbi:MAG: Eco57I restriction-modification methylase domain-containing protein [Promethearchaeota archaeon]